MNLFSAIMTAAPGHTEEAGALLPKFRDAATAAHGIPTSAWSVLAGAPFGTFALSARVDGTAQLLEGMTALSADPGWNTLVKESGSAFIAPAETVYSQVIVATGETFGQSPIVSVSRAVIAPGQIKAAVTAAVGILEFAAEATGVDGILTMSEAGRMNEVSWIFGVDSADQGDAANAALAANPDWIDVMDASGSLFEPGSGERMYLVRLP